MARVLVMDDDDDLRELIRLLLVAEGHEVDAASDGRKGLACQRARPADVIVTDIFMPNQDGIETIALFKAEFPQVKVIAMSGGQRGMHARPYLRTAREIGADGVLSKPFDPDRLIAEVRRLLA